MITSESNSASHDAGELEAKNCADDMLNRLDNFLYAASNAIAGEFI